MYKNDTVLSKFKNFLYFKLIKNLKRHNNRNICFPNIYHIKMSVVLDHFMKKLSIILNPRISAPIFKENIQKVN